MRPVLESLAREPYEHRGILHSEIALILATVRALGVRVIVESGRARGQSTYLLNKYLPDVEIHSVELRPGPHEDFALQRLGITQLENGFAHARPGLRVYLGDGSVLLPQIAAGSTAPTAVLCDGPKGAKAVDVVLECFKFPHVVAGFVHDMRKLDHGAPSPHRAYAIEKFPSVEFSDDPWWIEGTSWLDAEAVKAGGPVGPQHEAEFGSYGPTLGVFINNRK